MATLRRRGEGGDPLEAKRRALAPVNGAAPARGSPGKGHGFGGALRGGGGGAENAAPADDGWGALGKVGAAVVAGFEYIAGDSPEKLPPPPSAGGPGAPRSPPGALCGSRPLAQPPSRFSPQGKRARAPAVGGAAGAPNGTEPSTFAPAARRAGLQRSHELGRKTFQEFQERKRKQRLAAGAGGGDGGGDGPAGEGYRPVVGGVVQRPFAAPKPAEGGAEGPATPPQAAEVEHHDDAAPPAAAEDEEEGAIFQMKVPLWGGMALAVAVEPQEGDGEHQGAPPDPPALMQPAEVPVAPPAEPAPPVARAAVVCDAPDPTPVPWDFEDWGAAEPAPAPAPAARPVRLMKRRPSVRSLGPMKAATRIQSVWRGHVARKWFASAAQLRQMERLAALAEANLRVAAATVIQAHWRGGVERQAVAAVQARHAAAGAAAEEQRLLLRTRAATALQCIWRGRCARKAAAAAKEAEAANRALLVLTRQRDGAAVAIQSSWKGFAQRQALARRKAAAAAIQRQWRRHLSRRTSAGAEAEQYDERTFFVNPLLLMAGASPAPAPVAGPVPPPPAAAPAAPAAPAAQAPKEEEGAGATAFNDAVMENMQALQRQVAVLTEKLETLSAERQEPARGRNRRRSVTKVQRSSSVNGTPRQEKSAEGGKRRGKRGKRSQSLPKFSQQQELPREAKAKAKAKAKENAPPGQPERAEALSTQAPPGLDNPSMAVMSKKARRNRRRRAPHAGRAARA